MGLGVGLHMFGVSGCMVELSLRREELRNAVSAAVWVELREKIWS